MESNKDLLIPVISGGQWKKKEEVWTFVAQKSRYIRVHPTTTFEELIDMVYCATEINRDDDDIEVHAWDCFPNKQIMPPFQICNGVDVVSFVELNRRRDAAIPLCITNVEKVVVNEHCPCELPSKEEKHVDVASQSVNQQQNDTKFGLLSPTGLEDIKFTEDLDDENNNAESEGIESDNCCDFLDYDESFEYDNDERDLFDSQYDPHFGVFVGSDVPKVRPEVSSTSHSVSQTQAQAPPSVHISHGVHNACPLKIVLSKNTGNGDGYIHDKDFREGELVMDKDAIMLRLRMVSMKANREFRVTHSDRRRLIARCVDKSCLWRFRGSYLEKVGVWTISRYVREHKCSAGVNTKEHRGVASSLVVAHMVKDDNMSPLNIKEMLQRDYGVNITYWKAWKAKEIARKLVCGLPEDSHKDLASDAVKEVDIKPSFLKLEVGRPKKKRILSPGGEAKRRKCGKCKQVGHNKQTCNGNEYVQVHANDKR